MEYINNIEDMEKIKDNEIIGNPEFINSKIIFKGYNNIIFFQGSVKLENTMISFEGNNSVIYLSSGNYSMNLYVRHSSAIFLGKNNKFLSTVNINIQEGQNLIIGDEGIIGSGVNIRSFDGFPIYDSNSKERVNVSKSIIIGDHVWIDHNAYISRGAKIGSGSIIGNHSFVAPNTILPSNTYALGNPMRIIQKDVFFLNDFISVFTNKELENYGRYKSDVFIYEFLNKETLNMDKIDEILKRLSVNEKLDFIQKLFVKNKFKNRFFINK